jgi:hypothetical protein
MLGHFLKYLKKLKIGLELEFPELERVHFQVVELAWTKRCRWFPSC